MIKNQLKKHKNLIKDPKIITKKALPYSKSFEKNGKVDKNLILEAINLMNGTKLK